MSDNGWATEPKKELMPREVLMVAHAHLIGGVDQHRLAALYSVNQGRINEAIMLVRDLCENHRHYHKERVRKQKEEA